jgi:hypothetical protein
VATGNDVTPVSTSAALTVRLKLWVAVTALLSFTVTVTLACVPPPAVGVPLILPELPSIPSPCGNPLADQV